MGLEGQGPASYASLSWNLLCADEASPTVLSLPAAPSLHQPSQPSVEGAWPACHALFLSGAFLSRLSLLCFQPGSCNIPTEGLNNKLSHVPKDIIFFKAFSM